MNNNDIKERIRILNHRLWRLAKIGASTGMILDSTIVIGGRGGGKTYHMRIFSAMQKIEMERGQLVMQASTPVPRFKEGIEQVNRGGIMFPEVGPELIMLPPSSRMYGPSMLGPAIRVVKGIELAMAARQAFRIRHHMKNLSDPPDQMEQWINKNKKE